MTADAHERISLEEQIEAVEFHAGIRSVPADYSSAHEYAALRAAAATLRELQKYGFSCTRIVEARLEPSKWDD